MRFVAAEADGLPEHLIACGEGLWSGSGGHEPSALTRLPQCAHAGRHPYETTLRGREHSGTRGQHLMQRTEIEIGNAVGLDTPASARVARLATQYQCEVSLSRSGRKVNAKSLMGVAMLAAPRGCRVVLETDGVDEDEALAAIGALIREPATP